MKHHWNLQLLILPTRNDTPWSLKIESLKRFTAFHSHAYVISILTFLLRHHCNLQVSTFSTRWWHYDYKHDSLKNVCNAAFHPHAYVILSKAYLKYSRYDIPVILKCLSFKNVCHTPWSIKIEPLKISIRTLFYNKRNVRRERSRQWNPPVSIWKAGFLYKTLVYI